MSRVSDRNQIGVRYGVLLPRAVIVIIFPVFVVIALPPPAQGLALHVSVRVSDRCLPRCARLVVSWVADR